MSIEKSTDGCPPGQKQAFPDGECVPWPLYDIHMPVERKRAKRPYVTNWGKKYATKFIIKGYAPSKSEPILEDTMKISIYPNRTYPGNKIKDWRIGIHGGRGIDAWSIDLKANGIPITFPSRKKGEEFVESDINEFKKRFREIIIKEMVSRREMAEFYAKYPPKGFTKISSGGR